MIATFIARLIARVSAPSRREPWWISLLFGLELASGGALALWGGFSLVMIDFDFQPAYDFVTRWIDGHVWAGLAFAGGVSQASVAALDLRRLRWCMAFGACLFWCALALGLLRGSVMPPGAVTNLAWGLANWPTLFLLRPRWR